MSKQIFKNGNTKWVISMIVLIIGIGSLFGRQFQRLDHLDIHIEQKADKVVVDLHYVYIKEQLAVISKQIADLKKDDG